MTLEFPEDEARKLLSIGFYIDTTMNYHKHEYTFSKKYIEQGIKCYERRKRCIQFRGTNLNFPKISNTFFLVCLDLSNLLKLKLLFLTSFLKLTGWCYTGNGEFGYCSEINDLPDTPDAVHPLLEVQTFILPKEVSTTYTKYTQTLI